jgi:hypothetical protein
LKAGSSNVLTTIIISSAQESSIRTQIHLKDIFFFFFFFPNFRLELLLLFHFSYEDGDDVFIWLLSTGTEEGRLNEQITGTSSFIASL